MFFSFLENLFKTEAKDRVVKVRLYQRATYPVVPCSEICLGPSYMYMADATHSWFIKRENLKIQYWPKVSWHPLLRCVFYLKRCDCHLARQDSCLNRSKSHLERQSSCDVLSKTVSSNVWSFHKLKLEPFVNSRLLGAVTLCLCLCSCTFMHVKSLNVRAQLS